MTAADAILPDLALSAPAFDRRGDLRADPDLLPRLLADPATRVVRLVGDRVAVTETPDGPRLVTTPPDPADSGRLAVFLGETEGATWVGVVADDLGPTHPADDLEVDPPAPVPGAVWHGLRRVGADLDPVGAAAFATTLALGNWHRTHGFCPRCGEPTHPGLAGWIRRCSRDGSEHYPRTDMAVIMAVVDADDRLLLARGRGFRRAGMSVLAGFVEPGETLASAVAREVLEEVGVVVEEVTYLGDQPWPFPTSLMLGFTARALGTDLRLQEEEIAEARWFTRDELRAAVEDGSVLVSGRISISRRLVEHWYGGPLDAPDLALR
ncbi:NAD(+) diphosphatase [Oryzobacter sp. R7]|uniref:NAD(+) diphosphatase n=1 Tax=Oryzobacter faecalis TaxID=3388656 RepID=UPI00398D6108